MHSWCINCIVMGTCQYRTALRPSGPDPVNGPTPCSALQDLASSRSLDDVCVAHTAYTHTLLRRCFRCGGQGLGPGLPWHVPAAPACS